MENTKIVKPLIPYQFYTFRGCTGESDNTWHAGSMHKAMDIAGIQDYNIITYTSIFPACAEEIDELPKYKMGTELKGIIASMNGRRDELLAAGVAYNWLYEDEECTVKVGGIAVEITGNYDEDALEAELYRALCEIKNFSYSKLYWNIDEAAYLKTVFTPQEAYGTAYAGLVFINYIEQE